MHALDIKSMGRDFEMKKVFAGKMGGLMITLTKTLFQNHMVMAKYVWRILLGSLFVLSGISGEQD